MADEMLNTVIVGSGLAGLSAAATMSGEVIVLETGGLADSRHKNLLAGSAAVDIWQHTETDPTFQCRWTSSMPPHFVRGSGLRERVGGRSLYWHGVSLPIEDDALCSWPPDVVAALKSGYVSTIDYLDDWIKSKGFEHGVHGCRGTHEASLLARLAESGYAAMPTPQVAYAQLVGNEMRQIPFSPLETQNNRTKILTDHRVLSILPKKDSYELSIAVKGERKRVVARRVILAASVFENTRLVGDLLMNLRGEREISFPGLNDHIVQGFVATFPMALFSISDQPARAFCFTPVQEEACSNLFWDMLPKRDDKTGRMAVWTMGEKLPGESRITLRRGTWAGGSEVWVEQAVLPADLEVASRQRKVLAKVAERLFETDFAAQEAIMNYATGTPSWIAAWQQAAGASNIEIHPYVYPQGSTDHESGTLPLGKVLDEFGRLPEAPGISVIGPATFPRSGAANPSLTTIALARGHMARLREC